MELTPVRILGALWAVVTFFLAVVWLRRGILSQHEEDGLFLDKAEDHIRKEQEQIISRIQKMDKIVLGLGVTSGILLVVWAAVWVYIGFTTT